MYIFYFKKFQTFNCSNKLFLSSQNICKLLAFSLKFSKSFVDHKKRFFFHSRSEQFLKQNTICSCIIQVYSKGQRKNSSHDFKFAELGPLVLSIAATYSFPVDRKRQPPPYVLCTRLHLILKTLVGNTRQVCTNIDHR